MIILEIMIILTENDEILNLRRDFQWTNIRVDVQRVVLVTGYRIIDRETNGK